MIIRPVSYRQLLDDPECEALLADYSEECSLPELGKISPQRELYAVMETAGGLQCFGVYENRHLIGFISLLIYTLPHYGKRIATTESIFLSRKYRTGRAGMEMLRLIEDYAKEKDCTAVLYTAPVYSRFSALLSVSRDYRHSNNVFVRSL